MGMNLDNCYKIIFNDEEVVLITSALEDVVLAEINKIQNHENYHQANFTEMIEALEDNLINANIEYELKHFNEVFKFVKNKEIVEDFKDDRYTIISTDGVITGKMYEDVDLSCDEEGCNGVQYVAEWENQECDTVLCGKGLAWITDDIAMIIAGENEGLLTNNILVKYFKELEYKYAENLIEWIREYGYDFKVVNQLFVSIDLQQKDTFDVMTPKTFIGYWCLTLSEKYESYSKIAEVENAKALELLISELEKVEKSFK